MKIENGYGIFDYDGRHDSAVCESSNGKNWRSISNIQNITIVDGKGRTYTKDESIKGFITSFFAKYYLVVNYKLTYFDEKISEYKLQLNKGDFENALEIVSMFKTYKQRKTIEEKEQEEKLRKDKETNQIEIIDINGNKKKIWLRERFFKDEVLVTEGSTAYHTHADCYLSWSEVYKRKFKGWKVVLLKDAKARGLKECEFCIKYYNDDYEKSEFYFQETIFDNNVDE